MPKRAFLLAALLAVSACRKSEPVPKSFTAPADFKAALGRTLDKYAIVQGGLAEDNLVLAKNAMSAMHGELHSLLNEGLDSAAKAHFDSVDMAVMTVLHDTAFAFGGLPVVRRLFRDFTPLFADLLERFGAAVEMPIFLLRCPEGGPDAGDWLQREEAPLNPFGGPGGKACGKTVRRLGA